MRDAALRRERHRTVQEVHALCDGIEEAIQSRLPGKEVTIHAEPDDGRYRGPLERMIREGS